MGMAEQEAIISHIEECKHRIDNIKSFMKSNNDADCEQCANNICVLENVIKALEKQMSKKPIIYSYTNCADCPICGAIVRGINKPFGDWCSKCGTKLDWGNEEAEQKLAEMKKGE